jgi:translation elongation factor EF-Ts
MGKVLMQSAKELQSLTGAVKIECAKTLEKADGDIQGAIEIMQKSHLQDSANDQPAVDTQNDGGDTENKV